MCFSDVRLDEYGAGDEDRCPGELPAGLALARPLRVPLPDWVVGGGGRGEERKGKGKEEKKRRRNEKKS